MTSFQSQEPNTLGSVRMEQKPSDEVVEDLCGEEEFPDGGLRAWLVVFGGACAIFSTVGLVSSWGAFQGYYHSTLLASSSPSAISWIGGLQYFLIYLPGVLTGRLFDIGYFKVPIGIASIILILSTFLVGECTQYWHFLVCQGIATGLACGCMYSPTISVLGHWFKRRLGVAISCTALGGSLGGTIFPIAARHLIPKVGFPWTMRIFGFILIFTLSCTNLCLARRLPPTKLTGPLLSFDPLRHPPFTVYIAGGILVFLGAYTVPTYITSSAKQAGISEDFSFYLVTIINAATFFGRIGGGFLIDWIGAINTIAPVSFIGGILTIAWPFAKTQGTLACVATLYGIFSGSITGSFQAPVFRMGDVKDVGKRSGVASTLSAFGDLFGLPIAGAIEHAGYEAMGYYGGALMMSASVLMFIARCIALGGIRGKY